MSTLLPCPFCGPRPVAEFRYGAEVTPGRPAADVAMDEGALASWLYDSNNPKGAAEEWWQHTAACRTWFVVRRDTACDAIVASTP